MDSNSKNPESDIARTSSSTETGDETLRKPSEGNEPKDQPKTLGSTFEERSAARLAAALERGAAKGNPVPSPQTVARANRIEARLEELRKMRENQNNDPYVLTLEKKLGSY